MARTIKWIAGIIVGLIILSVIAVYVILSGYDFNDLKPQVAKAAKDATGRELNIGGDIDLEIGLTPSLVLSDITFQNAPWGSRPEMVKIKRFEVQVALLPLISGNIEIKRFILVEPDILIETDKTGKLNLAFETLEKTVPEKAEKPSEGMTELPAITFNMLEIEKGALSYRDGKTGKTTKISLNRLSASAAGMDKPMDINLNGEFDKMNFELSGTLGPIADLLDPEKLWPLKIAAKALDADINIEGSIKDVITQKGIDLGFKAKINDWKKISEFTGQPVPVKDPLSVSGRAKDEGPGSYKVTDLNAALGKNSITGSAGINLSKTVPYLNVVLNSKELDLRTLLPKENGKEKQQAPSDKAEQKSKKVFPNDPLPLDVLNTVDGDFKIRFDKIILPQLVITNLKIDTAMKKGRLSIDPLKGEFGGGVLNGSVFLKPVNMSADFSSVIKLDGLKLESAARELGMDESLTGNLDLAIDLKGQGKSVADLMAGLNGSSIIIMSDGKINNKYINLMGGDISTGLLRILNPVKEEKEYTDIGCVVSRFDIKSGLADSTVLLINTDVMSVVGQGQIDLRSEKLNISLKPTPKKGVGGLSMSLSELAKPFKLSGTLAEPSLGIDPAKAALAIGKAIGGTALFGPAGIAASLLSKTDDDSDLCSTAVETAKTGIKPSKKKQSGEEKSEPGQQPTAPVQDAIQGVGDALKGLFGR